MYINVTLWCVRITNFAGETQQRLLCAFELHITLDYIKKLSVEQQYFYGKFISPLTINHSGSSCKVSDAARKQKKIFVCSLPSFVICGLSGCIIFSTSSHKGHDFGKQLNIKCAVWLSLQLLSETFLILRRLQRDITKSVRLCLCTVLVIPFRFLSNESFRQIIENFSSINFRKNPSSGSQRTDGRTCRNS